MCVCVCVRVHVLCPFITRNFSGPEVICTWSGQLPARRHKNPTFSPRVFLGGVPWDITEAALLAAFQPFGNLNIDWPGKDSKHNRHPPKGVFISHCLLGKGSVHAVSWDNRAAFLMDKGGIETAPWLTWCMLSCPITSCHLV